MIKRISTLVALAVIAISTCPTGWVDRVEGTVVVVTNDNGDESYHGLDEFSTAPKEGMKVVCGIEDTAATQELKGVIADLTK